MSYRIAVIGTGYVGLVTGTCLADVGNSVLCIDVDPTKVERLSNGDIPIYEPAAAARHMRRLQENLAETMG